MNIFKTIKRGITGSSKKAKVAISVLSVSVLLSGVALAGWTPNRPVFDWNKAEDRKGSMNGPRINAFVNTPSYGDERAFFDARKPGETTSKDVYRNVTQGTREVILRTFVHNGANESTNASGTGIARNAKVRVDLPSGTSHALRARSYVSISNPAPGYPAEVTDTTELVSYENFSIEYIPGSAKIINNAHPGGVALPDSIVSSGATIGHDQMNGNLPGCFEYAAFVEIRVRVKVPEADISKQVRKAGTTTYGELATVKPGEEVQWLIKQDMKGTAAHTNVRVFDALPKHLKVEPGSVRYIYRDVNGADKSVPMNDTDLFTKQVNFGTWQPGTWFFIRFDTIAQDTFDGCDITLTNQARSNTTQQPAEQRDNAQVRIVKENCVPNPTYRCDLLKAVPGDNRNVKFTTNATAENGATIKQYEYDFGDDTDKLVTDKAEVEHRYAKPGTYRAKVTVFFDVNGVTQTHTAESCEAVINFPTQPNVPPRVTTPGSPTTLPSTGPGDVIATILAVTVGSSIAYYLVVRRLARF